MLGQRKAPMKRTGRLPPVSKKQAAANAAKKRAYKEVDAESTGCCFTCHRWAELQHSHIFPQGMNKLLRALPANILLECAACHALWGEKLTEYARRYPEAIQAKADRMQQIDRQRWAFWMSKNAHLLPARSL